MAQDVVAAGEDRDRSGRAGDGGRPMRRAALGLGALALSLASACGGGMTSIRMFTTDWTDDGGRSMADLQAKLASTKAPRGANVAVGVAGNGDKLIGQPLDGGAKWTFAHPLDTRPLVTGQ